MNIFLAQAFKVFWIVTGNDQSSSRGQTSGVFCKSWSSADTIKLSTAVAISWSVGDYKPLMP